ncbi:MAG: hypothetical protein Q9195_003860 [Heterodermia aff. obscurata]
MFSYLHGMRPGSRRSALPPATTPQHATAIRQYHDTAFPPSEAPHLPPPSTQADAITPSPIASNPPVLPPIPRVASQHESDRPEGIRTERYYGEDKGTQLSDQAIQRPTTASEQKGIHPRGPSLIDRPPELFRSQTIAETPQHGEPPPWTQERPQQQPTITHTTIPVQNQRLFTKPVPRLADPPLPLPRPHRQPSKSPPPPQPPLHVRSQTNPRQAKTKLNLLNPMSLLARRRSSQAVAEASRNKYYKTEDIYTPALSLPDNYDPRIRGNVVHDFDSAPRSARSGLHSEAGTPPKSANGQELQSNSQYLGRSHANDEDSPSSTEKEHTPVFKEHFDDGIDIWQEGREGPTKRPKSGFMYKVALQEPGPHPDPASLPAFARNLPSSFPTNPESIPRVASPPRPPLEVVLEAALSESLPKNPSIISSPPTSPPSKARSRASSNTDPVFIPAGLPKRFKSDASRFSFDLAGVGSAAQEQLLEEKHRQKAKEKARAYGASPDLSREGDLQDEDMDSVYSDDIDDDAGLEEKIPGVNADADEDVPVFKASKPGAVALNTLAINKTAFINPMSPVSEGLSSPGSPQYLHTRSIGFQHPQPFEDSRSEMSTLPDRSNEAALPSLLQTLQSNPGVFDPDSLVTESLEPLDARLPERPIDDYDDDMYFDDGMIEDMEIEDGPAFDETQFDDETSKVYGIPIRDLPKTEHTQDMSPVRIDGATDNQGSPTYLVDVERDDMIADELRDSLADLNQTSRPVFSNTAGLTQDNLAAYHDALAFAANQAALSGKFTRQQSVQSQNHHHLGFSDDAEESPVPVEESPSLEINGLPLTRAIPVNDDYDFDDALSDDAIIAAANAEALENDDDGFYGQEFGFFAAGNGTGEYANGGFFGQGIIRSHSGRNADQALTPITERSEWSNRNSGINLALHSYSQMPTANPGLAQMMHLDSEDNNMSLSALLKLRRGAWGSSTTSLHSSSGTSGSPLTFLPPPNTTLQFQQQQQQRNSYPPVTIQQQQQDMSHSTHSPATTDEDSASDHSHTITLPVVTAPPFSAPLQSRPRSELLPKPKGHSRHGSGDRESVSYVQERDGDGERWVLEKRRVGEGGVVEVLGREVVEGGRI